MEYTIKIKEKEISFVENQVLGRFYELDSYANFNVLCIDSTILEKLGVKETDLQSGAMIKIKGLSLAGKPAISEYVPILVSGSGN